MILPASDFAIDPAVLGRALTHLAAATGDLRLAQPSPLSEPPPDRQDHDTA